MNRFIKGVAQSGLLVAGFLMSGTAMVSGQTESAPSAPVKASTPIRLEMPKSYSPLHPYMPDLVPEPVLANSPRIDQLMRDGKLYLSLRDAIDLALENNLDLAIARYNIR